MSRPTKRRRISSERDDIYRKAQDGAENSHLSDTTGHEPAEEIPQHKALQGTVEDVVSDDQDEPNAIGILSKRRFDSNLDRPRKTRGLESTYAPVGTSNAMRLRLEDMLEEDRSRPTKLHAAADQALHRLKHIIDHMPETQPLLVADAEKALIKRSRVAVPFPSPRPSKASNYKLQFQRPSHINVVGSYALKLVGKPKHELRIDMLVTMPFNLFQDKDYRDHRYFYRRAFYLAHIAAALKDADEGFDTDYAYLNGNYLHPILLVSLDRDTSARTTRTIIQIIPGISDGLFPPERSLPSKTLIRQHGNDVASTEGYANIPTPFYNGSLRMDALFTSYLKLLSDTSKRCAGFEDACALGRIWLRRRGLASKIHTGGYGNFEWACSLALLLSNNHSGKAVLSPGYNGYQLFKGALQFLATSDLSKEGFQTSNAALQLPLTDLQPCFYDTDRGHNILYKMTPWSWQVLHQAAQNTTESLAYSLFDSFTSSFLLETTSWPLRYDALIKVPLSVGTIRLDSPQHFYDTVHKLWVVLQRALTDRVRTIDLRMPEFPHWSLISTPSRITSSSYIVIGLIVNPAQVSRAMDRGPSMDSKTNVKAYLKFWGHEKAVRMKFGAESPVETVKWETEGEGPSVLEQIIDHVLRRHFGSALADISSIVTDPFVPQISRNLRPLSHGLATEQAVLDAFARLEQDMRSLEDLPLQVRHLLPSAATLRHTQVLDGFLGASSPPLDVVVQFEGSSRWPSGLHAIQRTKAALLLKLKDLFEDTHHGTSSNVGLENQRSPDLNQAYLDVTYADSRITFRLRIDYERESDLLVSKSKDLRASELERHLSLEALFKYKRDFVSRPAHTRALQTLCTRFPSLPAAIRLVKSWFSTHMLLDEEHINEELIELMVAQLFIKPWPWEVPGSPSIAFSRVLRWLGTWDWKVEPLIVDFSQADASDAEFQYAPANRKLQATDVLAIRSAFEAIRKTDPALNRVVLFAASNVDRDGITWSAHAHPSKAVAARLTRLAQAATLLLQDDSFSLMPQTLFAPSLEDYDFVVHLNSKLIGERSKHSKKTTFKNLDVEGLVRDQLSLGHFDPILLFLQDLRHVYTDAVLFFYDQKVGCAVGCLWNPAYQQQRWKVKTMVNSKPSLNQKIDMAGTQSVYHRATDTRSHSLQMNQSTILNEIAKLGGDMVSSIVVNKAF